MVQKEVNSWDPSNVDSVNVGFWPSTIPSSWVPYHAIPYPTLHYHITTFLEAPFDFWANLQHDVRRFDAWIGGIVACHQWTTQSGVGLCPLGSEHAATPLENFNDLMHLQFIKANPNQNELSQWRMGEFLGKPPQNWVCSLAWPQQ